MSNTEPTIKIYKRKNAAGEVIGWSAEYQIPGSKLWADVRERGMPTDYWGSIYPTKEAVIEAARREIRVRR